MTQGSTTPPSTAASAVVDGGVISLDDAVCADPAVAGAKAAWLSLARASGLPVLPGVVVPTTASLSTMQLGVEVMGQRGSGGARLAMSTSSLDEPLSAALAEAITPLTAPLVVRSSSTLEASGEWSGAFTSYLEIFPEEIDRAVLGCWASAFTVHAIERQEAAGMDPGTVEMAVLVQPALDPTCGGTARLSGDDVLVVAVHGSPAPLVQGWEPGSHVRVSPDDDVTFESETRVVDAELACEIAGLLRSAKERIGATTCEWALADDRVWILQAMPGATVEATTIDVPDGLRSPSALRVAHVARRAPGPLGETLVVPWAAAAPHLLEEPVAPVMDVTPVEALRQARDHVRFLVADVWGAPRHSAPAVAATSLQAVRGPEPAGSLADIAGLRPPDPELARLVLGLLATVRNGLVAAGAVSRPELAWFVDVDEAHDILTAGSAVRLRTRIGFDRWEPYEIGVVMANGVEAVGTSAAPGQAAGRLCFINDANDTAHFRSRDIVVGVHPLPNLAPLLWDAAALVTTGGGAAAHLFESARALGIPAVCGVHLDAALGMSPNAASGQFAMAVDGTAGAVFVTEW